MTSFQFKKRIGVNFSRTDIYRLLVVTTLSMTFFPYISHSETTLVSKAESNTEDMPVLSDDYDPIDYLPPGLPPSKNDPAEDIKSIK